MLPEPKMVFSHWVAWKDRADLRAPKPMMGVYMWAHLHEPPDRKVHPYPALPRELVYVGETNDLNSRPLRGNGHQRLEHYRDTFPADGKLDHLYVAGFRVREYQPASPHRRATRAFTQFMEGKLYWEYTRCYERRAALLSAPPQRGTPYPPLLRPPPRASRTSSRAAGRPRRLFYQALSV